MASFIFHHIKQKILKDVINFDTDSLYARLVTAIPAQTSINASQLVELSGGTYAPKPLANKVIIADGNNWIIDADDPTFNLLTGAGSVVGMVTCIGTSPSPSDFVVTYNELVSAFTPNGSTFQVILPNSGIMKLV